MISCKLSLKPIPPQHFLIVFIFVRRIFCPSEESTESIQSVLCTYCTYCTYCTMLKAEQLPGCIAHLDPSLTNVNADHFPLKIKAQLLQSQKKKDKYRRKGKGRRCCFGDRIYSFACHASYFAYDDFEEQDEYILFFQIIMVQVILFFKSSQCKIVTQCGKELNQFCSPNCSNDLCLLFCLYPSSTV